ncbi:unnamed protein product [Rotaria sp. Silwood1]|nr:unnamed protein product [Rotaria sp. Silwood1]CAF1185776.1 unnamed protein product [Rotaria sp. Silwood1]CAF3482328.1 unnamed protein product [Rotaria sp. Silwood1]CAF3498525.1 unnamed protein product [Rotaria sp. Silwood1]CAF4702366.1 unnamed protein product [Rotaria sp. Silwood1]
MKFIVLLLAVVVASVHSWTLDYTGARQVSSPHFNRGRQGHAITCLVLHGTAGGGTIEWFQNPSSKVSAHYVVGQDGSVTQMVSEDDTAWHNGVVTTNSQFYGRANPNLWCIGIEFSRNVQNNNVMPEVQIQAGIRLVADIKRRYQGINIYTHDQFNVGRTCPGPNFPLARFKSA